MQDLAGKTVAILATDGFEQSELMVPRERLREAGARVDIVAPEPGEICGWKHTDWGDRVAVDRTLGEVAPDDYDCLVLPGGQINPDLLRVQVEAIDFINTFLRSRKPVAAICHGPWVLIEADAVRGRKATSYHSIKTDMINAGAEWVDQDVVVDGGLITSRTPDDLPAFCDRIIETIKEGSRQEPRVA